MAAIWQIVVALLLVWAAVMHEHANISAQADATLTLVCTPALSSGVDGVGNWQNIAIR